MFAKLLERQIGKVTLVLGLLRNLPLEFGSWGIHVKRSK